MTIKSAKAKILMIDDDSVPDARNAVASYMWYYADELRGRDCHVIEAIGVDDALAILAKDRHIDLIVLDVMMPTGKTFRGHDAAERGLRSGVCLAEKIRDEYERIPIVVLTNVASEQVLADLKKNPNVKRVLLKFDVKPSVFADEVAEVLQEQR